MAGCGQRTGERLLTFLFKELGGVFYLASDYLINTVKGYEEYIRRQGIDEQLLDSYKQAIYWSIFKDRDTDYGVKIAGRVKDLCEKFIFDTTGGTAWDLEKYAFKNGAKYQILDDLYETILVEAQNKKLTAIFGTLRKTESQKNGFICQGASNF